jgi:hypothetical protein
LEQPCYVFLHLGLGPSKGQVSSVASVVVDDANPRLLLSSDFWIERLNQKLARNLQLACEPRQQGSVDVGHDRHLYAFVRRVPTGEVGKYEGLKELGALIALSRLVRPTSIGERYCALVTDWNNPGSRIEVIRHVGAIDVFLGQHDHDWLSVQDGQLLAQLTPWASSSATMHPRVHRAFWNYESAMRSPHLDTRWPLIVSGFEALTNTRDSGVTWQFRDRVGQLAKEFNVNLTDHDLHVAYQTRSKLIHAESFLFGLQQKLTQTQQVDLYERMESILRQTILRSLLDRAFGDSFATKASVNKRWRLRPHPSRRRSWLCRILPRMCDC